MEKKKSFTIYDLARKLNYSPSTISRALKNHHSISEKTIKIVKKAAEEEGYRPNILAASLRNNQSKTIGVLVTRINRPFISSLISGIENAASKEGYNILISQSNDIYKNEVASAKALFDSRVCGIIASLGMETESINHFKQFSKMNIPVVFVDRVPADFKSYTVVIDNYTAAFNATTHLIEQGCKRIAHFAGAQHLNVYQDRKKGYTDALIENGIAVDESLIITMKTLSSEEGETATTRLMQAATPPDGIFCSNDTTAVSAILTLKKMGIKIPEEVAVIGFNDDPISSIVEPALSTVSHPAIEMGELCTQRILQHVLKKDDTPKIAERSVLDTHLIIRASSTRKNA
ncbi:MULTISPECIES: LacI family DNA-binding transcriptional regulator [unclassified Leeuwenhoekiella]|uniref:LacI family DNA-binding transcriptional regulator n=1 Tax=unclassified Leeuwenhoekiella TaxID=2615029 RepID=UPI000C3B8E49|nr:MULTISPECIES: LacI family DNA-binding transcriptional regulator [unclassified Leeuwenhoekiella]MAW93724.1 LacI family transcriptional regulator [Leeuwenhoekiella sp.]MBA83053.1 LacI family transcriptional regulator [Leeuwenhoekiella sp.]|tara:strand:- start:21116 stop:22153 length:1038 start_codon:yes stop_codon:yes gene_type:complete